MNNIILKDITVGWVCVILQFLTSPYSMFLSLFEYLSGLGVWWLMHFLFLVFNLCFGFVSPNLIKYITKIMCPSHYSPYTDIWNTVWGEFIEWHHTHQEINCKSVTTNEDQINISTPWTCFMLNVQFGSLYLIHLPNKSCVMILFPKIPSWLERAY